MKLTPIKLVGLMGLIAANFTFADRGNPPEPPEPPAPPAKPFVGVVTSSVSKTTAAQLGLPRGVGLSIESVVKGSAAEEYGLKKYDIMIEMNGQLLTSVSHFTTLIYMNEPGDKVVFKVLRKGKETEVEMVMGSRADKRTTEWKFDFEEKFEGFGEKMELLGERLERMAEEHELMSHVPEAEEIEEHVRSALAKAQYHIEKISDDDGDSRISIVHSGNARKVVSADEGTLIIDPSEEEGKSFIVVVDGEGETLYKGLVSEDADELSHLPDWVSDRYAHLNKNDIRVIVRDEIIAPDVDVRVHDDDGA